MLDDSTITFSFWHDPAGLLWFLKMGVKLSYRFFVKRKNDFKAWWNSNRLNYYWLSILCHRRKELKLEQVFILFILKHSISLCDYVENHWTKILIWIVHKHVSLYTENKDDRCNTIRPMRKNRCMLNDNVKMKVTLKVIFMKCITFCIIFRNNVNSYFTVRTNNANCHFSS